MAVEVDFVTLGDASKKLGVPSPTLRLWTDDLEKHGVHYVKRNQRDERIYYDNDLEIFAYMRNLKKEHGRKTQTKDIAFMIYQEAMENDMFDLRRKEDAPKPESTNTALELLSNEDLQKLFQSDRASQVMQYMMKEASEKIRDQVIDGVRTAVRKEVDKDLIEMNKKIVESHEQLEKTIIDNNKRQTEMLEARMRQTNEYIAELREKRKKPWWKKMFSD